ncbi:MAG TPA: hypothetical protein VHE30_28060 [Polyangiaceae bacterium]|nr:hypothetical protein [Polyangiaceae bacterium]
MLSLARGASAAPSSVTSAGASSPAPGEDVSAPVAASKVPALGSPSGFAVGLEGYGGLNAGTTRGESRAHAFAGADLRLRLHYAQVGAFYEGSDLDVAGRYRAIGGFAGVWFPYSRWVDVEGSVGLASRAYVNDGPEYGPGGLDVKTPELVLRAGVSDRTTERLLGARIGGAIVFGADLGSRDVTFHKTFVDSEGVAHDTSGTTAVGGVTIGIVIALGLELGGGAHPRL